MNLGVMKSKIVILMRFCCPIEILPTIRMIVGHVNYEMQRLVFVVWKLSNQVDITEIVVLEKIFTLIEMSRSVSLNITSMKQRSVRIKVKFMIFTMALY